MTRLRDLTDQRFGRVVALYRDGSMSGSAAWRCRCDCGQEFRTQGYYLTSGDTKSCGCLKLKHRATGSPTYQSWRAMFTRCTNPNHVAYQRYGGRGITIAPEWGDFRNFLRDMGERPVGLSLDRIDNNRGYGPDNCKWSTPTEQANNRCNNRRAA